MKKYPEFPFKQTHHMRHWTHIHALNAVNNIILHCAATHETTTRLQKPTSNHQSTQEKRERNKILAYNHDANSIKCLFYPNSMC